MKYIVIKSVRVFDEVCTIHVTLNSLEDLLSYLRVFGKEENNISINITFKK